MNAKALAAVLLCLAASVAHADTTTWGFTYRGFFDDLAGQFRPDHVLSGQFTGEDANKDGVIEWIELRSMSIDGDRDFRACMGNESPYYVCGVGPFSYTIGGALEFSLGEEAHDRPVQNGWGHRVDTGQRDWTYRIVNGVYEPARSFSWTDATTLQVSVVPEAPPLAMFTLGLLALGLLRKRAGG